MMKGSGQMGAETVKRKTTKRKVSGVRITALRRATSAARCTVEPTLISIRTRHNPLVVQTALLDIGDMYRQS